METEPRSRPESQEPLAVASESPSASDPGSDSGAPPRDARGESAGPQGLPWGRILLIWVVVATPLSYLVYLLVEPRYESVALFRAEPPAIALYETTTSRAPADDEFPYLATQVQLMTGGRVLEQALARPGIGSLALVRESKDPVAELRRRLKAEIVGNRTYLIRLSLESRDPAEAASLVNAVAESYIGENTSYHKSSNRALRMGLVIELEKLRKKVEQARETLVELAQKSRIAAEDQPRTNPGGKNLSEAPQPSLGAFTREQLSRSTERLLQADFDLIDALARLDAARLPGSRAGGDSLRELEFAVAEARQKQARYARYIEQIQVRRAAESGDSFRVDFLTQDLAHWKRLEESVKLRLAQLDFEIGRESYRITVHDPATAPKVPSQDIRLAATAATPAGVLLLILSPFLATGLTRRRGPGRNPAG